MSALPQNSSALNRAALKWLKAAKAPAPTNYLHVLNLAQYGLELLKAGDVEWPAEDRQAVKAELESLLAAKPALALLRLAGNPNGAPQPQTKNLHQQLQGAPSPQDAAMSVLDKIWHVRDGERQRALRHPSSSFSPSKAASAIPAEN